MTNFWEKLSKPFTVLAPMDDVTDNVFRKVVNDTSRPDVFFTEFVSADGLVSDGRGVVDRKLKFEKTQHPIVAQIWSNDPEKMYQAASIVSKMGFSGIDINMGCPVREVVKKNAGAGLIGKFDLAKSIIEAVKKGAGNLPVSVKTRLGINLNIADAWATFLLSQNIAALTVHARTAVQMSKGFADWDEIAKIVSIRNKISPDTLVVGNGDVKNFTDVLEKHQKYGVDGVMIGRGIFSNPWVFEHPKKAHKKEEYISLFLKHLDFFEEENKDKKTMLKRYPPLKKFLKMYINNFNGANKLRQTLMDSASPNEARQILAKIK
jgi:nifR3 family TIM-barrel protein